MKYLLPLGVLGVVVAFLFVGLRLKPSEVPSPFIGKQAPAFALPRLHEPAEIFKPEQMQGKVWLFNVWASWCVSCRAEHPILIDLAKRNVVPIIGLNYKDRPADAKTWLKQLGNPYALSVSDLDGRVGIDFGVYGVPETFVIDKRGLVQYKHIGPVSGDDLTEKILPLVARLQAQ
ncbi:MAG TPA: DsbE family thiol:disulfide interchange protein [Burkholderiales bacterium]|nr:DsbE family thiol:disulfide interchange protein [Burkholderiales bacterium]